MARSARSGTAVALLALLAFGMVPGGALAARGRVLSPRRRPVHANCMRVLSSMAGSTRLVARDDEPAPVPSEVRSEIAHMALPAVVGILISPILSLIDTMFIGLGLGKIAHAATGPASELFAMTVALTWAIEDSTSSNISRLLAKENVDGAARYLEITLALALILGVVIMAAMQLGAVLLLSALGAPPSSAMHVPAMQYVRIRAYALPTVLLATAAEGAFRGFGDTRTPLLASGVAAALNIVLDPLLMFTLGMGMRGAALATALAQVGAAGVYAVVLRRRTRRMGMRLDPIRQLTRVRPLLREGATIVRTNALLFVRTSSIISFWIFVTALATRLGPVPAAAHHTMLNLWLLFVLAADGPAVAGQVLSARAVVTGRMRYLRELISQLFKITSVLSVVMSVAMVLCRPLISRSFTRDAQIRQLIYALGLPVAVSIPMVMASVAAESLLIGGGLSRYAAISTFCASLSCGTVAYALYSRTKSVFSIWAAINLLFTLRFSSAAARVAAMLRSATPASTKSVMEDDDRRANE